ncbi:MAG: LuxR C-terminal-related transcriptional regulator [Candidatus Dormibacter sp.]
MLTPAERRVLTLAEEGCSIKEIAERPRLSVNTVKTRLQSIFSKFGTEPDGGGAGAAAQTRPGSFADGRSARWRRPRKMRSA